MARTKTAKRHSKTAARKPRATAKTKTTRSAKANNSIQRMEKDWLQTPAKLAAQSSKEANTIKQKENKLKAALQKLNAQIKKAESRLHALEGKKTAASKKQLSAQKKSHSKLIKSHTDLHKQHQEISKNLETANNQRAKFIALGKQLSQFEKEWAQSLKNAAPKKAKASKSAGRKASSAASESQSETYHNNADDIESIELIEETTEVLS